jgi:GAF domain-containing protein
LSALGGKGMKRRPNDDTIKGNSLLTHTRYILNGTLSSIGNSMIPLPQNDNQRVGELTAYRVLDTPREPSFDALTRLAARLFNVSIALVSLVDKDRQWFKSCHGLEASETPRNQAFCTYAIMEKEPMVILDATQDERFSDNPLVTGDPGIRFYAGAPLITPDSFCLGTFCIIGTKPREAFLGFERNHLIDFASTTMDILEMRRRLVPER